MTEQPPPYRVRGRDIIAAAHVGTGMPLKEVEEIARRLREADLFVRETKSPRSWMADETSAVNLLIAILSNQPAQRAATAIIRAERLWSNEDDSYLEQIPSHPGLIQLASNHPFTVGVMALINFCKFYPSEAMSEYRNSSIEMQSWDGSASISILSGTKVLAVLDYLDPSKHQEMPDLNRSSRVTMRSVYELASVFRREDEARRDVESLRDKREGSGDA